MGVNIEKLMFKCRAKIRWSRMWKRGKLNMGKYVGLSVIIANRIDTISTNCVISYQHEDTSLFFLLAQSLFLRLFSNFSLLFDINKYTTTRSSPDCTYIQSWFKNENVVDKRTERYIQNQIENFDGNREKAMEEKTKYYSLSILEMH